MHLCWMAALFTDLRSWAFSHPLFDDVFSRAFIMDKITVVLWSSPSSLIVTVTLRSLHWMKLVRLFPLFHIVSPALHGPWWCSSWTLTLWQLILAVVPLIILLTEESCLRAQHSWHISSQLIYDHSGLACILDHYIWLVEVPFTLFFQSPHELVGLYHDLLSVVLYYMYPSIVLFLLAIH